MISNLKVIVPSWCGVFEGSNVAVQADFIASFISGDEALTLDPLG
jgi:hypothetical protein